MQLADVRRLTPATQNYVYFQTSGFSPSMDPVVEEVIDWMRFQNQGPAVGAIYQKIQEMFEQVRGRVARTLGADSDEIMLSENATVGINVVANGIDWQPGDNVILSTHEHPGNRIPWYNLIQRYGVQLRFLTITNDQEALLGELDRLSDTRTRLVSLSHVSRRTGLRLPAREITEIAHGKDVPVLFDGAQSFGAVPVDVKALNCDFYTFSGHKYIMAPKGTGGLYVRRDRIEWLKPSWIGSHSQKEMDLNGNMTLHDSAKRFEFGTRNLADQAGFGKALEIWESIGWQKVFGQIENYTDRMKGALQSIPGLVLETPVPYAESSGIVTFSLAPFTSAELSAKLLENERTVVSTLEANSQSIRVSTHVFNTDEEIECLVNGLRRIQQGG
jgi:L-cysteine/cystine lyase